MPQEGTTPRFILPIGRHRGTLLCGRRPIQPKAIYMLISTVTIPTKKGRPMVEGLDKLIAGDPEKDQQLDLMEETFMPNPEEDLLRKEDEEGSKEKEDDPVEVEAEMCFKGAGASGN